MYVNRLTPLIVVAGLALAACGDDAPSADRTTTAAPAGPATPAETTAQPPAGAPAATLIAPVSGARIAGVVDLEMVASGVTIEPAGAVQPGAGHFHVIADTGCLPAGTAIGKDADHVHFGTGATTGAIYLDPGSHTLCLQVGDGAHTALDITHSIQIEVGIDSVDEFCDVFAEADALLTAMEPSTDEFAVQKVSVENARRLMAQLTDALGVIDAAERADVAAVVDAGRTMMEVILAAESEAEATEQLWGENSVLPGDDELDAGAAWLLDTCGVSID